MGTVGNRLWENKGWVLIAILVILVIVTNPGWITWVMTHSQYSLISLVLFGILGYKVFSKILDNSGTGGS